MDYIKNINNILLNQCTKYKNYIDNCFTNNIDQIQFYKDIIKQSKMK